MIPAVNFGLGQQKQLSQPLRFEGAGCSKPQPQFKGFAELGSAAVQRTQEGLQAAETRIKGLGQKLNLLA